MFSGVWGVQLAGLYRTAGLWHNRAMTDEPRTFTAVLMDGHAGVGTGEMVEVELVGDQPPVTLRRPIEERGHKFWQVYTLVGTSEFPLFAEYVHEGDEPRESPLPD